MSFLKAKSTQGVAVCLFRAILKLAFKYQHLLILLRSAVIWKQDTTGCRLPELVSSSISAHLTLSWRALFGGSATHTDWLIALVPHQPRSQAAQVNRCPTEMTPNGTCYNMYAGWTLYFTADDLVKALLSLGAPMLFYILIVSIKNRRIPSFPEPVRG